MTKKIKQYTVPLAAALFVILIAQPLAAWGPNGHRITAEVAQRHLTSKAKKAVEKIMDGKSLAFGSTWPDFIRSEKEWDFAKPWHYITVEDDEQLRDVMAKAAKDPKINDVVEAIDFFAEILRGNKDKTEQFKELLKEKGVKPFNDSITTTALIFLVHFTGDVHQPLHVGRGDDYGGNKIKVRWFGQYSNLHSVWDGGLIESEQLSFTEFTRFIDHLSKEESMKVQNSTLEEWAQESIDYRPQVYKGVEDTTSDPDAAARSSMPGLSYQYAHDNMEIINNRLVKGGIRLAGLLNDIFK
jgi:hypothetical protein